MDRHLAAISLAHARFPSAARAADWRQTVHALSIGPPLFLVHDLGVLLTQPRDLLAIERPAWLPGDMDTSTYLEWLTRLSGNGLLRRLSTWDLSDPVAGVILARLFSGVDFPEAFRPPAGTDRVWVARRLADALAGADPARIWEETRPADRPGPGDLPDPMAMARIEGNLRALDPDELSWIHRFGTSGAGAPDPRELVDLFGLMDLPPPVKTAVNSVLRLIPRVSQSAAAGGVQTYAMGGYAGLTRKGRLDSLVPTELAYGEDMLCHRLLNREALYYGREREKDRGKELAYIVTQAGLSVLGDAWILAQALTLALGRVLAGRGWDVRQSFVGGVLTEPADLEKASGVHRLLHFRDRGITDVPACLDAVAGQLRAWRDEWRTIRVFWVLDWFWDADGVAENEERYRVLRELGEQRAWFVKVGKERDKESGPAAGRMFSKWDVVETGELWKDRAPPVVAVKGGDAVSKKKEKRPARFTNSLGMEFVWIEPGTFMMGSRWNERGSFLQEHHKHEVTLTRGYYLQTTPVTQGQWKAVMGDNPSAFKDKGPDCPVEQVSWNDIQIYIQRLAELTEGECRLPTEAEWEYACRAGSQTAYSFGADKEELDQYAWFRDNSGGSTRPVGLLKPNAWGLRDMHGNVLEWCHDRYGEEYPRGPLTDPTGPDNRGDKNDRVVRGGGWCFDARSCRSAFRGGIAPDNRGDFSGFRVVMPRNPDTTRIATRDDWDIHPMPEAHRSITIDRRYSDREFSRLAAGEIPKEMEDKWFIYYDEPWLHLHRSWTGYCLYQVRFESSGGDMVVAEAIANRDPSQNTETNDARDAMRLCKMLDGRAGRVTQGLLEFYHARRGGR